MLLDNFEPVLSVFFECFLSVFLKEGGIFRLWMILGVSPVLRCFLGF